MAARTNSSWAPCGPRNRSRPRLLPLRGSLKVIAVIRKVQGHHIEDLTLVPLDRIGCRVEGGDVWFALDESYPLACFAGIWANWTSVRKVKEGETTNDL